MIKQLFINNVPEQHTTYILAIILMVTLPYFVTHNHISCVVI
jgi:hypothetical protein